MQDIQSITGKYAVGRAGQAAVIEHAARAGFRTILHFVPDGENPGVPGASELARAAAGAGLAFHHIPAAKFDLLADETLTRVQSALAQSDGPVLGLCTSGQRAAILWAAVCARSRPVDEILRILANVGFDLAFLRDDLDAQAGRCHWLQDGGCAQRVAA